MWNITESTGKMELKKDMTNLIEHLQEVEKEFNRVLKKYSDDFSNADKKQQDILHYIEFKNVSSVAAYRLVNELSKIRKERRMVEDNIDLLNRLGSEFTFNNKKRICDILNSKNNKLKQRVYKTRYYSPQSLETIANKRKEQ